ncbi:NAD(P)-binding protein [Rhodotorula sp. JG-1b]|nr:NAD(P)-binding protein [Rhodotorula sp. JG-1b]
MAKTVLVTGASGFLASYVVDAFLQAGWRVKGTVRNKSKADHIRSRYPSHADQLDLVEVKDIVSGDGLKEAMQGVDAVAHTASPYALTYTDPIKDFIDPAVKGTLTVLQAAKDAGIRRVVITSSFAAVTNFNAGGPWRDYTYTAADWNPLTLEDCLKPGVAGPVVYSASKTLAERAAHNFAAAHQEMIISTLNPPMIYGPPLQNVASREEVNTSSAAIYALINGEKGRDVPWNRLPLFVHVKDIALAHVRALEVEDEEKVKSQRFLLYGGAFTWEQAVEHLAAVRPELKPRLPSLPASPEQYKDYGKPLAKLDCTPAKEVLGIKETIGWQQTLEETIDALVEIEKRFA